MRLHLQRRIMVLLVAATTITGNSLDGQQFPIYSNVSSLQDSLRVAIIGAGIAGSFAAYTISEQARGLVGLGFDITLFEANSRVGGRIKQGNQFDDPRRAVEVGADEFSQYDWCVIEAAKEAGMDVGTLGYENSWGVWDEKEFIIKTEKERPLTVGEKLLKPWWELFKLSWRYGMSPWKFSSLVESTSKKFHDFALSESVMNGILTEFNHANLDPRLLKSAHEYLNAVGISSSFQTEVIEPYTRSTLGRNLTELTGLDMMLLMQRKFPLWRGPRKTLRGKNYRLIERILRLSNVSLRLESHVKSIAPGLSKRYRLLAESTDRHGDHLEELEFDMVILAAPLQLSGIILAGGLSTITYPMRLYAERHITHFVSGNQLPGTFFNDSSSVPENILTKSGLASFFSIEWLGSTCRPAKISSEDDCGTCEDDNLYRILSAHPIDDTTIHALVGHLNSSLSDSFDAPIAWTHRQVWEHAAPIYQEQVNFVNEVEIAEDLFYTGGAEELYTSLEISCRMGKMVGTYAYRRHAMLYR